MSNCLVTHFLPRFSDYMDEALFGKLKRSKLDAFKTSLRRSEGSVFWSQLEQDGCIPRELAVTISEL